MSEDKSKLQAMRRMLKKKNNADTDKPTISNLNHKNSQNKPLQNVQTFGLEANKQEARPNQNLQHSKIFTLTVNKVGQQSVKSTQKNSINDLNSQYNVQNSGIQKQTHKIKPSPQNNAVKAHQGPEQGQIDENQPQIAVPIELQPVILHQDQMIQTLGHHETQKGQFQREDKGPNQNQGSDQEQNQKYSHQKQIQREPNKIHEQEVNQRSLVNSEENVQLSQTLFLNQSNTKMLVDNQNSIRYAPLDTQNAVQTLKQPQQISVSTLRGIQNPQINSGKHNFDHQNSLSFSTLNKRDDNHYKIANLVNDNFHNHSSEENRHRKYHQHSHSLHLHGNKNNSSHIQGQKRHDVSNDDKPAIKVMLKQLSLIKQSIYNLNSAYRGIQFLRQQIKRDVVLKKRIRERIMEFSSTENQFQVIRKIVKESFLPNSTSQMQNKAQNINKGINKNHNQTNYILTSQGRSNSNTCKPLGDNMSEQAIEY